MNNINVSPKVQCKSSVSPRLNCLIQFIKFVFLDFWTKNHARAHGRDSLHCRLFLLLCARVHMYVRMSEIICMCLYIRKNNSGLFLDLGWTFGLRLVRSVFLPSASHA